YVCGCCDRGQVYCGPEHRDAGRRASCRRSNALHQGSPEGREDHQAHSREYRRRLKETRDALGDVAVEERAPWGFWGGVRDHPVEEVAFVGTRARVESAPAVMTTTAPPSAGEGRDGYDDREAVRGADADALAHDAGAERHRQGDPAARAE